MVIVKQRRRLDNNFYIVEISNGCFPREREERMAALNAQEEVKKVELQKKIQQKVSYNLKKVKTQTFISDITLLQL